MLYYLFTYLDKLNVPGAGLFNFLTFRAGLSMITALLIAFIFGKKIITFIQKKQIGETVRDLGLEGQMQKAGTPTMGGLIIIFSILVPVLLFAKIFNIYIILMLLTTLWLGTLGFLDDYIKVFKKNKGGVKGKFKIVAQFSLGLIIALVIVFNQKIKISEVEKTINPETQNIEYVQHDAKTLETTIPFFKNNQIDYGKIIPVKEKYNWINTLLYIGIVILIIVFVSNGVNLTDGLDGLAAGTSSASAGVLAIFAYISGNFILADYLSIMYIPNIGEIFVFASTLVGATIGFLWYNAYPAKIFMGDTGSLTLGGIVAVLAILVRKEWLLPIFGGIFFIENISVMMQVSYFKYTKKRFGEGKRIFLMSPLHHHYQKKGIHEAKIVTRFIIIAIFLAVISLITLKVR
ncbi:MAG: phospho-N-acetylmuramoyl-pentapeptide-transferase [Bacteroidales bacterium]|nr:phospho-N-acetylmuramoyl-pentapeptide-transferase [Bacteroidales bacterium]